MFSLFKKAPMVLTDIQMLDFDNIRYPLDWEGEREKELSKIVAAFDVYIDEEIDIQMRMKEYTRPELLLVHQLAIINTRSIAFPHMLLSVERMLTDDSVSLSHERLLDVVQYIQMTVKKNYLLSLKGLFLYSVLIESSSGDRRATPTEEDWVITFRKIPWIHYLPIFSMCCRLSSKMNQYRAHVANERDRATFNAVNASKAN